MGRLCLRVLRTSIATLLRGGLAFGAFAACAGYATSCHAERRLALVVGNERYENIAVVPKATEDARAVAAALTAVGYRLTVLVDVKRPAADAAFKILASQIEVGDILLLYFVGNSVSLSGKNLLLFVDAPAARAGEEARVVEAGLPLDEAVVIFQKRGAKVFAIVDAARPNPFDRPGVQAPEFAPGTVPMAAPPPMTYWMFSASQGETALTRTGPRDASPNSVFARVLLSMIGDDTPSIAELAIAVQQGVRDLSSAAHLKQVPLFLDGGLGSTRFSAGKVVVKYPDKLKLRAKPDGGNRYTLAEIADIEDELPAQEDCERLGQKFGDELRRETAGSIRFWVRMKRADIGYCQLAQNRWFVEYFDRNIQDGLVLDLRN